MLQLLVTIRTRFGDEYEFRLGRARFTIGRRADCALALPAAEVSSRHAEVIADLERGAVSVTDLGSKNGTSVDGHRLTPGVAVEVQPDSAIEIAEVTLRIRLLEPSDDVSESLSLDTSNSLSRSLLRGFLGEGLRRGRARLDVVGGPARGRSLVIDEAREQLRLGTGEGVDLELGEASLSGNPVLVMLCGRGYQLIAPPGVVVRVGKRRIEGPHALYSGDKVRLLRTALAFNDPLQGAIDALDALDEADDVETGAVDSEQTDARYIRTVKQPKVGERGFGWGERVTFTVAVLSLLAAVLFLLVVLEIISL